MRQKNHRVRARTLVGGTTLGFVCLLAWVAAPSSAAVRTAIPAEDPGPPFYARVERPYSGGVDGGVIHTDEWAAIVFYRDPTCVPSDFNLLDFFDIPGAFDCRLTVAGFEIWKHGPPPLDAAPMHVELREAGTVPVWFVSWAELQAAMADDVLTVDELLALPSLLQGSAASFHETLHPTDGARRGNKLQITASGTLSDGRTFKLTASRTLGRLESSGGEFANVRIHFA